MLTIQCDLHAQRDTEKAKILARFFKTGKGEYGEEDRFLGLTVPSIRSLVKRYAFHMSFSDVEILLSSEYHEDRLAGVLILVSWAEARIPLPSYYKQKKKMERAISSEIITFTQKLATFYIDHIDRINNWDLIDSSSDRIIGPYLVCCLSDSERSHFIRVCLESEHLWTIRMIVIASFYEISRGSAASIFSLVRQILVRMKKIPSSLVSHDLIQKASGWMLREVGKRIDRGVLEGFLEHHAHDMPRTMLRYAIEKFDTEKRTHFLTL